jgi:hypothetical protein
VRVREENGVNPLHVVLERLVAKVGSGVDQYDTIIIEGDAGGGSISVISGVLGAAHLTRTAGEGNSR